MTLLRLASCLLVCATFQLHAAFEPIQVKVTRVPELPAGLKQQGLRNGQVVVAIDVDAGGKLVDWLVVAASHRELIPWCVDALKEWEYRPASLDGAPVLGRERLTIDVSQIGAIVSRTSSELLADFIVHVAGRRFDYRTCPPNEMDRPLAPVATVAPRYSEAAARDGISGRVPVYFYVDERGTVRMPAVPSDVHPYLSGIAVEAIKQWKFAPPTRGGRPVQVAAVQEFAFTPPSP